MLRSRWAADRKRMPVRGPLRPALVWAIRKQCLWVRSGGNDQKAAGAAGGKKMAECRPG